MTTLGPTYVRDGDKILAFYGNRLIAHGKKFAKVEKTAVEYLDSLKKGEDADIARKAQREATHVKTPNGLTGEILGSQPTVWGDGEITVRFENGRISRVAAHGVKFEKREADAPSSVVEYFETLLGETPEGTKESLSKRIDDLGHLQARAAAVISGGASYADQ